MTMDTTSCEAAALTAPLFELNYGFSDVLPKAIAEKLWNVGKDTNETRHTLANDCQAFFEYYKSQCFAIDKEHIAILKSQYCLETHKTLLDLAHLISKHEDLTKQELRMQVRELLGNGALDETRIDNSLELAARVLLLLNIKNKEDQKNGSQDYKYAYAPQDTLPWPTGQTLKTVIQKRFCVQDVHTVTSKLKFDRQLNGYWMKKIAGFKIHWTDNLLEHLALEDDKTISIFYHVSALEHLQAQNCPFLSTDLINETKNSIALITAPEDHRCYKWLKGVKNLDPRVRMLRVAPREVTAYSFWRDRLLIIQEAFDESEPETLSQWWNDRRKKVQWYTFWVAILVLILTLVFGLIQSVTGIMQVASNIHTRD